MTVKRGGLLVPLVILVSHLACAQSSSDDRQALESFKSYVQRHLDSYKQNRRERVAIRGGRSEWVKEYFEPNLDSTSIDVQKTNSLVSPYSGKLEFQLIRHITKFHKSRAEAAEDSTFVQTSAETHQHTYAYQDGKWVPKVRQYVGYQNELYKCDEIISEGPQAGERDFHGCLEEYDTVNP